MIRPIATERQGIDEAEEASIRRGMRHRWDRSVYLRMDLILIGVR